MSDNDTSENHCVLSDGRQSADNAGNIKQQHGRRGVIAIITAAAAAFFVVLGGVSGCQSQGDAEAAGSTPAATSDIPLRSQPAPPPSASGAPQANRFTYEKEVKAESGVFESVIADSSLPADITEDVFRLERIPGKTKIPSPDAKSDGSDQMTVHGIAVRVDKYKTDAGYNRQIYWVANRSLYVLLAQDCRADDNHPYGPSDNDVEWLVQDITKRFEDKR